MELLGIRLVGFNATSSHKALLIVGLIVVLWLLRSAALARLGRVDASGDRASRIGFWSRQGVSLVTAALAVIGFVSIWFDNPANLTTAVGLVTAGLAFALQRVVTALAGYFVILPGSTFTVGDRIVMGGVRGDVVALGFFQTTIMEMRQPPPVQNADPAVRVQSRQFTGRIVTVSNARIFDEAVYNYTRDFPFIWEEMRLPIAYRDDRAKAEQILLDAAKKHAVDPGQLDRHTIERVERDFRVRRGLRTFDVLATHGQLAGDHGALHRPRPRRARDEGRAQPGDPGAAGRGGHRHRLGDLRDHRAAGCEGEAHLLTAAFAQPVAPHP